MHLRKIQCEMYINLKSEISVMQSKKKERQKCVFPCWLWGTIIDVIILPDRCCLYGVDHLQSIARWDKESKKEKYTDRQTYWNTTGRSTVHKPTFHLMSILDRQRPLPIFHCSAGNYTAEDGELLKAK